MKKNKFTIEDVNNWIGNSKLYMYLDSMQKSQQPAVHSIFNIIIHLFNYFVISNEKHKIALNVLFYLFAAKHEYWKIPSSSVWLILIVQQPNISHLFQFNKFTVWEMVSTDCKISIDWLLTITPNQNWMRSVDLNDELEFVLWIHFNWLYYTVVCYKFLRNYKRKKK